MAADDKSSVIDEFLATARIDGAAVLVEGEAGLGKTTLIQSAVGRARDLGFRVLSAQPNIAEFDYAYSALVDLVRPIDSAIWDELPGLQRRAVDRMLLRENSGDSDVPADERAVAAGCLGAIQRSADEKPVLLAIDDMHWLDPSSVRVVSYVARRLAGRVGVLGATRSRGTEFFSWLQRADRPAQRISLRPMSIGALHAVLSEHLRRTFPRPVLVRIHEVSGGNPFYAIELGRALPDGAPGGVPLTSTLTELVDARISSLPTAVQTTLLAAACAAAPTVESVARSVGSDVTEVVALLEEAERESIVELDGRYVRFTHPLLARGVYDRALPADRRRTHRRLAGVVDNPESRARHLALGSVTGSPETLAALDDAAVLARKRGAPAAAAELVDYAIGLGGDTPQRQLRSARHHLDAGDITRAGRLLDDAITGLPTGPFRAQALALRATVAVLSQGYLEAKLLLEQALVHSDQEPALRAQALLILASTLLSLGDLDGATDRIQQAVATAESVQSGPVLSQALGIRALVTLVRGDGLDEASLRRGVDLEGDAPMAIALRPTLQYPLLIACAGDLDRARDRMTPARQQCIDRGDENEIIFALFYGALIDIWSGDYTRAARADEEGLQRAAQLGGDTSLFVGLTIRAMVAAYGGRVEDARRDAADALDAGRRSGSASLLPWTIATLGFLELSVGNHRAAVDTLEPLLTVAAMSPRSSEILTAPFLPDAAEALIHLGRLEEAESIVRRLEANGARLDRPWMLATGARCRAMLAAARGDLPGAAAAADAAIDFHARLPMPFELARTRLLRGQLHRRARQKDRAKTVLQEALSSFEALATPLWADRVNAELARISNGRNGDTILTASEQRVADLAASGMTNKDIAATLFISPKTVEVNLTRIYRKLGLRNKAELARRLAKSRT
ncbi:LuxR family transcriptional regulator [Nocardia sp. BMG111209]|uniref:helix-turn-helix transcriptional regulator n=1 Tax=Nocardia sp. BMG111209 TaxID=1160137 RepID=UPI00037DC7BB|nr:LuxR family transcriptional regulator [Nocardia sp. BMG111209]